MDLTIWCVMLGVLASGRAFLLPSPENVTVDCDNFETFVYWNYSENLVEPFFQVELLGVPNGINVTIRTREHYANLTGQLGNANYNTYTITVRATNPTSSFSQPVKFAYGKESDIDGIIKCKLDFPPVHMEYTYGRLNLRFQNPLYLYENTPALKSLNDYNKGYPKLSDSNLQYEVKSNMTREKFNCPYKNAICEENLHISDKMERYCINVSGNIIAADIERAYVRAAVYCVPPNPRDSLSLSGIVILVLVLLLAIVVLALGAFIIRKKFAKSNQTPLLHWKPKPGVEVETQTDPQLTISPVSVTPVGPADPASSDTSETPLLTDQASGSCRSSTDCSRFCIGPGNVGRDVQDEVNLKNEEVGGVTVWETSGGTHYSSDYDSREHPVNQELENSSGWTSASGYDSHHVTDADVKQASSVDMEGEEKSEQSDPGCLVNKKLLERLERLEGAQPFDCDSSHCMDARTENSGNREEEKPLSDYEPRHFFVEISSGDFVDGYATGETLD